MSSTPREVRAGTSASGGEAAPLVESAMLLRWRAPELALLLADRAVAAAQDDPTSTLRADYLAVFSLNRLGRYGEAAHRLCPAIHDAGTPAGLRHELYVELAHCAVALGLPTIALGAARAVLAAGDDVAAALRGRALLAVAEAATALGCDDLVSAALEEAEELYREDSSLDHDTALLLRAAIRANDAARHRARGRAEEAEVRAREGRELLAGLADPDHDGGEVSARLMLELALILLARGAGEIATQEVRPVLRRQVRAVAAGTVGRLRLTLATQVHLAAGHHEPALTLLADAVEGAQRFGLDAVLAECLEGLSHVHEARDEFADALHCMRAARAAEGRHLGEVEAARSVLVENFGSARSEEARLIGQVAELLANAGASGAGLDADTGSMQGEAMAESDAVASGNTAEVPVAEVLVAEVPVAEVTLTAAGVAEAEVVVTEIAAAEIAAPEITDAEVLEADAPAAEFTQADLPESDIDEEEIAAAEEEVAEGEVGEIEVAAARFAVVGAAEAQAPQQQASAPTPAAANVSLVGSGTAPSEPIERPDADSSSALDSWQSRARHRHGGAASLVSVSDLIPASALSVGRSRRRRVEEIAAEDVDEMAAPDDELHSADDDLDEGGEDRSHHQDESSAPALTYPVAAAPVSDLPTTPEGPDDPTDDATGESAAEDTERVSATPQTFSTFGPPPAPPPRVLEWEPEAEDPAEKGPTEQAPADQDPADQDPAEQELAAQDPAEEDAAPQLGLADLLAEALAAYQESRDLHTDARSPADADTVRDLPRYRGSGTRWTAGLALAPNLTEQDVDDPNLRDADASDPDLMGSGDDESSQEITSPLLRLPDFTAEPRWIPPEVSRRSAAGD